MRHRRFDFNLVIALQALLEQRSVSRAAMSLNISQPTMSGILQRLRESFNDPLLVQVGRHMRLTPLAETLIAPSQRVMEDIDALLDTQTVFDPASARSKIVIAASDYVVSDFLNEVLMDLAGEAPGLRFVLTSLKPDWGHEMDAGRVDYVICPSHLTSPEHPATVLFQDSYTVVAWSENSVVSGAARMTMDQYQSLGHVAFHADIGRPWFEQWYLTAHGDSRRVEMVVTAFNLMPALVVGTNRIATVQNRLAQRAAAMLPLKLMPMPVAVPLLVEVLQWSRHRQADPVHIWLRTRLLERASSLALR